MRWRRLLLGAAVVLVAVAAAGYPVYVAPARDSAGPDDPADAVVVLGGVPYTADFGYRLLLAGSGRELVISNAYPPGYPTMQRLCPVRPVPHVTCFVPQPFTTRGEAREIGRLAREHGWDDVVVVAPTFQISRARVLVERCYPGGLRMVPPEGYRVPWRLWPYNYGYQTAGFVKVGLRRSC